TTLVDPDWLAARVAADDAARAATVSTLLPELSRYLIEAAGPGGTVQIIDLGAGTGANQRWLAPRLPIQQRWLHLDHNPVISRSLPLAAETEIVDESVEALGELLTRSSGDRQLVSCSALLDVLTTEQIQAVCRAVIVNRVPAFFSLTVTGGLRLSPADAHDQLLLAAFNDHQRRAGRAGPEATTLTVNLLRAAEFTVTTQETPWRLTAESGLAFVDQMLEERLAAAVAQDPALARTAAAWLELRRAQLAAGLLRIELDHCDMLGLPGGR
ncbi:MAG: hypothetical protein WAN44_20930, partial [Propionibacteriaceae bacterium]